MLAIGPTPRNGAPVVVFGADDKDPAADRTGRSCPRKRRPRRRDLARRARHNCIAIIDTRLLQVDHNLCYRRNALLRSVFHVCFLIQLPELPTRGVSRTRSVRRRPGSVTAVITSVDGVRPERASHGLGRRPPTVHPSGTTGARQRSGEFSDVLYWGARHVPRRPCCICCGPALLFRHCDESRMPAADAECAT